MPQSVPKRLRLRSYDYSTAGAYFVTICTYRRQLLFDDHLLRVLVEATWMALPDRFPSVQLDARVVMPNHFHAIVWLTELQADKTTRPNLSMVIGAFKSIVAVQ